MFVPFCITSFDDLLFSILLLPLHLPGGRHPCGPCWSLLRTHFDDILLFSILLLVYGCCILTTFLAGATLVAHVDPFSGRTSSLLSASSYRPARLHRLAELIPRLIKSLKISPLKCQKLFSLLLF
jgi:hypothetical protein